MKSYLIDTNIIIDYLRGDKEVVNLLSELYSSDLCISVISLAEFFEGAYRLPNPDDEIGRLDEFLIKGRINILDINTATAQIYGQLQAAYGKRGFLKPVHDLLIASTALNQNSILVTKNKKDFSSIKGLILL